MSWVCVGCHQVQATKSAFMPVMNHTHQIVEQLAQPTRIAGRWAPRTVSNPAAATSAESQLRHDVRTAMEKDGANADLINATVDKLP